MHRLLNILNGVEGVWSQLLKILLFSKSAPKVLF